MVGGAIDPYVGVESILTTKFQPNLFQGDSENTLGQIAEAMAAYVAAGFEGATELGPAIDMAGYPNVTQPFTHAAWLINETLSTLGTTSIQTQSDVDSAKEMAYEMWTLYKSAIAAGRAAAGVYGPPPAGKPSGFGGPTSIGVTTPLPLVLGGGAIAGIALYLATRKKR